MKSPDTEPSERSPREIRESIRNLRRAVPQSDRDAASAKISENFLKLKSFQTAAAIAGFLAFDGEADPQALMIHACQLQKKVYVPMMVGKAKPLKFSPWSPQTPTKTNSFGIAEPDVPREQWVDANALDFVITPTVAFDDRCHRLGVGAGYYDRSFSFLNSLEPGIERPTKLIGFAFELQRVERIKRQSWDVVLDGIVTEWRVYAV